MLPWIWIAVLAAVLLALGKRGGWLASAGWLTLALVGQACALGLYRAGPVVSYHHYGWPADTGVAVRLAGLLAVQLICVLAAIASQLEEARACLARILRPWQVIFLVGAMLVLGAKISRPPQVWIVEMFFAAFVQLLQIATLALAVAALPRDVVDRFGARWDRFFGARSASPEPGGLDAFAWICAAWAIVVPALLCFFFYERFPHVPDEVAYLLHAEYLAQGRIALPAPPVPRGFDVDLMLRVGERWFSPVPPGWPVALAVGAFVGAPWLVNPVLSGACILLAYLFVREIADRRTARLTIALLCVSPWFLFLGMSFMTHTWTMCCALVAALGVARARRSGRAGWGWLAGAAIGVVSLIRPLEGLGLACLLGLWAIGLGGTRVKLGALLGLVLGAMIVGATVLPYNRELTGSAMRHPIMDYVDRTYGPGKNDLGFGPDKGLDWGGLDPWPGHTPFQALVNAQFNGFAVQAELFGWSVGSVLFVLLALLWRTRVRNDRLMWSVIAVVVLSNSYYWFAGGPDFGARYWYLILLPCVLLTISGFDALEERLGEHAPRARIALLALCAFSLVTFVPWRALDKYVHYRGMQPGLSELAKEKHFGRSLVLVMGERHPDYASAAMLNSFDWEADAPIYAWDRDPYVRKALLEHYHDRPVWVVEGPTRTGRGFEIVEGPRTADELLAPIAGLKEPVPEPEK